MDALLILVIVIIAVALIFDYINGFHDAANSIATVVSTRVLSPGVAVAWAAFFNFVAAFVLGTHVAKTIGKGMIDISVVTPEVILAGLIGAIFWNLLTWWWGLPSSSSHALAGGMIGGTLPLLGTSGLVGSGIAKIVVFIVLSPVIGMVAGSLLMVAAAWIVRSRPLPISGWSAKTAAASPHHATRSFELVSPIRAPASETCCGSLKSRIFCST